MREIPTSNHPEVHPLTLTRRQFLKLLAGAIATAYLAKWFRFTQPTLAKHEVPDDFYLFTKPDKLSSGLQNHILDLVLHPPKIDDPKDADTPVSEGFGYATYYNWTEIMFRVAANNWPRYVKNSAPEFTKWSNRIKYLESMWDPDSNQLTPQQALDQNKVVGFVAMRGNDSAGKKYLLATVNPLTHTIDYHGWVGTIDCAAPRDFLRIYSKEKFNYGPYKEHPQAWIAEASAELYEKLPNIRSPKGQRPGVILIEEAIVRNYL